MYVVIEQPDRAVLDTMQHVIYCADIHEADAVAREQSEEREAAMLILELCGRREAPGRGCSRSLDAEEHFNGVRRGRDYPASLEGRRGNRNA